MLAERGLVISAGKMSGLWSGSPNSVKLAGPGRHLRRARLRGRGAADPEPGKVPQPGTADDTGRGPARGPADRPAAAGRPVPAAGVSGGRAGRGRAEDRAVGDQLRRVPGLGPGLRPGRVPGLLQLRRPQPRTGDCAGCGGRLPLKKDYCRLCWCQARDDRDALAADARSAVVLAAWLPEVRHHQLFFAGMDHRRAQPRAMPRRHGVKGRPRKPPPPAAIRPWPGGIQLALFEALPRAYAFGRIDLRSGPAPANPWLAWALHLAHTMAETRGFDDRVHRELNRNLVALLAGYAEGEAIRVSDFGRILASRGASQAHRSRS